MASRSRIPPSESTEGRMSPPDLSRPSSVFPSAELDESIGGVSIAGGGKKRSRVEINRRVPQQSFAYGAPSDGKTKPRSSGGRKSAGEAGSPTLRSQSPDKPPATAAAEDDEPQVDPAKTAAAARYAELKARKQLGAKTTITHSLNLVSQTSPAPRRSARLSIASGSVDAEGEESRRKAIAEIDEDLAESSGEEDEHGNTRKSSVPPPHVPASTSATTLIGRSRGAGAGTQLNSYFLRDPGRSISPASIEDRRGNMVTTSSLLRGVQKPFRDTLSPTRGDGDATRSSDAGDSRSYASEEAYVQRQAQDESREVTPPARPGGWLQNLSPWRRGISASNGANGHAQDHDRQDIEEESAPAIRRKARTSQDKTYRPPKNGEDESSSEGGDDSKAKRYRRRKSDDKGRPARGGRDDNKIWSTTKSRRAKRGHNKADEGEGDSSFDTTQGDEEKHDDDERSETTYDERNVRSRRAGAVPWLRRSTPAHALKLGGLLLGGLLLASTLSQVIPWSLFQQRPEYTPPSFAPKDFEGFVSRLLSLESTVGALSSKSVSLAHSHDQMSLRISALELSSREIKALLTKVDATEGRTSMLEEKIKPLEKIATRLQSQLEKVAQLAASAPAAVQEAQQDYQRDVDRRLKALQADLKKNEEEMAKMKDSASRAEVVAHTARDALQPLLEANLPAQMPVRLNKKTGKPQIEPWFYESLKGVIAQIGGGEASESPSWDKFRSSNEAALRALINQETKDILAHQRSAAGGHAIISRSDFLEVLHSEIEKNKATLEETFNRNAQGIQNEILAKVRDQQTLFEKSGSWSKSGKKGSNQQQQQQKETFALPLSVDLSSLQTKDGSDPTKSILALIEAALETYSADRINRADYALYSSGGRIIPSMTSASLEFTPPGSKASRSSWLTWVPGLGGSSSSATNHLRSRSPVVALHHDNSPGMCWPFRGSSGQLGIHLAQRVLVTDITIEHPSADLTFGDSSAAPREITISALVEDLEDQKKLAAWRLESSQRSSADGDDTDEIGSQVEMQEMPPSANHIHLASFNYDASLSRSLQTFPVSAEARALAIPVNVLQVRILSNHGNQKYTCLYRIRVHGERVAEEDV